MRLAVAAAALAVTACTSAVSHSSAQASEGLARLPLVERPARAHAPTLALVMSGDGNWANFIRVVADSLVTLGVPVVGLESRKYLAQPKTPDEVARDMQLVLEHYLDMWQADSVLIVGYSRGADFAPFVVNRLPPSLRARVVAVGLLAPTRMASFEFHLLDLVRTARRPTDLPMLPEVRRLAPLRLLCVYGSRDSDSLCPLLDGTNVRSVSQDAGHRLHAPAESARQLAELIGPPER